MRFNLFQILLLTLISGAEFHRGTIGSAEENATVKTEEPTDAVDPSLKVKLSSPRETLKTFFGAFKPGGNPENAALTLNLSEKPLNIRSTVGIHDAYQLKDVIDRMVYVQYYLVPDDPESKTPFRLSQITTKLTGADEDDAALIEIAPDEAG